MDSAHENETRLWKPKYGLRMGAVVLNILVLILTGVSYSQGRSDALIVLGDPASISLVWCAATGLCLYYQAGHLGIHPAVCVGLDLLIWLSYLVAECALGLAVGSLTSSTWALAAGNSSSAGSKSANTPLTSAALALGAITTLIHIALFIIACRETHVRRMQRKGRRSVDSKPQSAMHKDSV